MAAFPLYHLSQAPSSQSVAKQRLEETHERHFAVLVDCQTEGIGRLGRVWHSRAGNLSLSIVTEPPAVIRDILPLALAVVVLKAMIQLRPELCLKLSLKWPNDILLDGKKISGLLIQTGQQPHEYYIMGIGVNLVFAPQLNDKAAPQRYHATCFADHVTPPTAKQLAQTILECWQWGMSQSPAWLLQEWQYYAHQPGCYLSVQQGNSYQAGEFLGLDAQGRLRLKTSQGEKIIVAGECFLTPPAVTAEH